MGFGQGSRGLILSSWELTAGEDGCVNGGREKGEKKRVGGKEEGRERIKNRRG